MADRRGNARPTGHPLQNVAGDHRLNDVNCGHLGRLTYVPVDTDEEQAGRLHTTRNIELTPHFQQIIPLEQLCSPSRSALPEVKSRPWRAVRSHRNWLLKSHPQALLGGPELGPFLSQEIRSFKDADTAPPISPLLALGEITDLRDAIQVTGQPAVAFAAGEGGHILQILTLTLGSLGWNDEGLALRFGTTQSSGRGQWIEDGNPISMIKFAVDSQKYDPIRWILVQKATSTIVLEPEIRKTPLKGNRLGGIDSRGTLQISGNPLFAINADKTGGASQSDVCFNPAASGAPPQLAIINTTGYWSIWDVTGNRAARPKVLRPVLRVCGSIDSGPIPTLPLATLGNQTTHRVSWISGSKEVSLQDQNYPERTPRLIPRADHILACNDTTLRIISIADGKSQTGLSVARPGKAEHILDVRICPFDPSKAFVLTTTTLFWVSSDPAGLDSVRLAVIISSPHYKKPNDGTLRLGVSPGIDLGHTVACFVCVYSSADTEASVFWFTKPTAEGPAQFCYRTICLDGPVGLNSMALSLLSPPDTQSGPGVAGDRKASALHLARFFQMFILGPDMGLGSSVIAWSPFPFDNFEPPTTTNKTEQSGSRRKKLIRHLGEAFVVPDGFDDHDAVPGRPKRYNVASGGGKRNNNGRVIVDFTFLSAQLQQIIQAQAARGSATVQPTVTPLTAIRAVIERGMAEDHSSFHLISEVSELRKGRMDVDTLQRAWSTYCDELQHHQDENISAIERPAYVFYPDSQRLREIIESQALLPNSASEEYHQRQQHVLRQVTAEAYMSLLSLSVAPHLIGPSDTEDVQSEGTMSQPISPMVGQSTPGSPTSSLPSRSGYRRRSSAGPDGITDPVVARLRKYLPTAAGIQPRKGHQSLLLSHWPEQPGSDVKDYAWKPRESGADEEMQHQRKRREEAHRRKLENRLPNLRPDVAGESSTQPLPRTAGVFSSQPQVASSSQGQGPSSSLFASQSMSQVIPGPHGGRPPQSKKKSKIKKEGRMRGFR